MRLSRKKRDDYFWGYLLIAPVTLGLAVFYFYPFFAKNKPQKGANPTVFDHSTHGRALFYP